MVARADLTVSCILDSGDPSPGEPSTTSSLCVEGAQVFRGPVSNPNAPGDVNVHVWWEGQGYVTWVIAQVCALMVDPLNGQGTYNSISQIVGDISSINYFYCSYAYPDH